MRHDTVTGGDRTFEWTFRAALWARPTAMATFAAVEAVHVLSTIAASRTVVGDETALGIAALASTVLLIPLVAIALTVAAVAGARRTVSVVRLSAADQVRIFLGLLLFAYAVHSFLNLQPMPVSQLPPQVRLDPEAHRLAVLAQLHFVSAQLMVYVGISALYLTRGTRRELAEKLRRPADRGIAVERSTHDRHPTSVG